MYQIFLSFCTCINVIRLPELCCYNIVRFFYRICVTCYVKYQTIKLNRHNYSKLNNLIQKIVRFNKQKEVSSLYTAPFLYILTSWGITNRHFYCCIGTPIQMLLGSSVAYFSPDLMPHDSETNRELLLVKKYLSKKVSMAYPFEIKDESSLDGEPVFPKLLREIMGND